MHGLYEKRQFIDSLFESMLVPARTEAMHTLILDLTQRGDNNNTRALLEHIPRALQRRMSEHINGHRAR